jgi:hypothetical protein
MDPMELIDDTREVKGVPGVLRAWSRDSGSAAPGGIETHAILAETDPEKLVQLGIAKRIADQIGANAKRLLG